MIWFYSDTRVSEILGVVGIRGVIGVWSAESCEHDGTGSDVAVVSAAGGIGMLLSTFPGLNGTRSHAANLALIFLGVKALILAGLYREIKCSLPIVFTPPRSSRSTCSQ
jgi:hypothetical protein